MKNLLTSFCLSALLLTSCAATRHARRATDNAHPTAQAPAAPLQTAALPPATAPFSASVVPPLSPTAAASLTPRQSRQYRRTIKAQSQANAREIEAQAKLEAARRFAPVPRKVKGSAYASGEGASANQSDKNAAGAAGAGTTVTKLDKTRGQTAVGDSLHLTSTAKNGVTGNGNTITTKQAASWKVWALWIGVIGGALGIWYFAAPFLAFLPSRQRLLGWAGYGKDKSSDPTKTA